MQRRRFTDVNNPKLSWFLALKLETQLNAGALSFGIEFSTRSDLIQNVRE